MARFVSRRRFVGLSAAGGAALLGGVTVAPAAGADEGGLLDGPLASGPPAPRALPIPALEGTVTTTLGVFDFHPVQTMGFATVFNALTPRVRRDTAGILLAPIHLPAGSRLARIDVFGYTDAPGDQLWRFAPIDVTAEGPVLPLLETTVSGTGATTGELVPDPLLAFEVGQWAVLQAATDATTWIRGAVVQYLPPFEPPAPDLVPIVPKRVYDSRTIGAKLGPDQERTISTAVALDGSGEVVPAGSTAVAITITVTETEGVGGFVAAFPAGATWPGTSTVNWFGPGQHLATAAVLALGNNRQLTLRGGNAPTHVVVDVTAYVGPIV